MALSYINFNFNRIITLTESIFWTSSIWPDRTALMKSAELVSLETSLKILVSLESISSKFAGMVPRIQEKSLFKLG